MHRKENVGSTEKAITIYGQPENCTKACAEILKVMREEAKTAAKAAAEEEGDKEEDFGDGFCAPTQRQLWNLFENPHHSKAAKVRIKYYFLYGL